jgi:sn-glycerol 3-phosphate transport system ATP-binding protein
MNKGLAEQIDTPLNVYQRPATQFVASFIGSPAMNFLQGEVANGGAVRLNGDASALTSDPRFAPHGGRPVTVGLRPEHLRPAQDGDNQAIELTVDLVETLGADTLAHGRLGTAGHGLTARLPGTHQVREGDRVPLAVGADALHLFDRDSGERLPGH